MIDRHQARILAMQALCQHEVLGDDFLTQLDAFLSDELVVETNDTTRTYARSLVQDTLANKKDWDKRIQDVVEHWELNRMAAVDRNALRVALCEFTKHQDISRRIVITEAMEIGREFGTAESAAFINGILDAINKQSDKTPPSSEPQTSGANDGTV